MVRSGVKLFWTKTLLNFTSKALSNSFFQKTRFRFEFLYKIAPHLFSSPNGLDGTIGGKSVPEWSLTHPKNTFLVGIFWWNRPHTSFLGLIGYMVHSGAKLFRTKILLNFASKALSNLFFQKTRFRLEFLYKIIPHQIYGPNGLDGTIRGKSVPDWSFVHPKNDVFAWNFLMKVAPYLFSGPNWLYGAFRGKIVPDENFAQFCLKSPLKFVFPKNKFSICIFVLNRTSPFFSERRTRWHDWGQKCPGAKFRSS